MVPKEKRKRKKCWSFSVGRRGYRVSVREEYPGSNIYIAMRDPELPPGSPPRSRSLGHRDREKAMEAGCDDYDTKPVEMERLLGKIAALLATKAA